LSIPFGPRDVFKILETVLAAIIFALEAAFPFNLLFDA